VAGAASGGSTLMIGQLVMDDRSAITDHPITDRPIADTL
jgi:hypothetical protein